MFKLLFIQFLIILSCVGCSKNEKKSSSQPPVEQAITVWAYPDSNIVTGTVNIGAFE